MTDKKQEFQKHIAGLRAVAIALVVLAHYSVSGFSGGFIGVDVFFVISGFLITGVLTREYEASRDPITRTGKISLGNFYLRRAKRLLPAAVLTSLTTLAWTYFNFSSFRFATTLGDFTWSQLFVANLNFALQDSNYFLQGSGVSVFRHFWSLSVEEQFYFLWPALLMAAISMQALRIGRRVLSWQSRALITLVVVTVISLASMLVVFEVFPLGSYYLLSSRAWELGVGGIAALLANHFEVGRKLKNLPTWLVDLSFVGMLASIFLVTDSNFGWTLLSPVLFSAVFIFAGGANSGVASLVLSTPPMQFVGRISYSLYLWHWPVLVFAQQGGYLNDWPSYLIVIALTVALSTLSYYFVERPFLGIKFNFDTTKLKPLALEYRARFVSLGVALLLVVAVIPSIAVLPATSTLRAAIADSLAPSKEGVGHILDQSALPLPTQTAVVEPSIEELQQRLIENRNLVEQSIENARSGKVSSFQQSNISVAQNTSFRDESGWRCLYPGGLGATVDCEIGSDLATTKMIFLGDSMVGQYQQALRQIVGDFPRVSVRMIWHPQCPNALTGAGLLPDDVLLTKSSNKECIGMHAYTLSQLAAKRYNFAFLGGFSGSAGAAYVSEAIEYAKKIKSLVKVIGFAKPLPSYQSLESCLNQSLSNLSKCGGNPPMADRDSTVADSLNSKMFGLSDLLCRGDICPALVGDFPVVNHGHLNPKLGYFLRNVFSADFRIRYPEAFESLPSAAGLYPTPTQSASPAMQPSVEPTLETLLEERRTLITESIRASYKVESPSSELRKNIAVASEKPTWTDETGWQCEMIVAASDCTIGSKTARKEWLVIGDSMAAQYRGAFRRIAENNSDVRVRLIYQGQCPNSITLKGLVSRKYREITLQANENCLKTHDYEQSVVRQKTFDLILLSDAGGDFPLYEAEATDFATQMKKHTKNLVVVASNPAYPFLQDCLNREETNLSDCSASSVIQDKSDNLVAQSAGIPLLRPQDMFCYLGKCPALIAGFPVSSGGHINADQSYFSGILFGEMIRTLAPTAFK